MDQTTFLKQMQELVEFGRTKDNLLTKEEVGEYCSDLGLKKDQLELVYAYLKEHQIHVPGYSPVGDLMAESEEPQEEAREDEGQTKDSKYIRVYKRELRGLPVREQEEIEFMYQELLAGKEEMISPVVESHLKRVVTLAGKYKGRGVPLEDLIQEANLELMTMVSMACGNGEIKDLKKEMDHAIRSRLIELVDDKLTEKDSMSTVLARVNLLLEATKTLAEEYGRVATIEELIDFTHMDREEIEMYVDFTDNKIELGKGEKNV